MIVELFCPGNIDRGGFMKVYLNKGHRYPKRLDDMIICYYCDDKTAILRKPVKRDMLTQNINIQSNQRVLCNLWKSLSIKSRKLFGIYAMAYKKGKKSKRPQGISGFSIFIQLIYKLHDRLGWMIQDMTYQFITSFLKVCSTLNHLMKKGWLSRIYLHGRYRNKSFIHNSNHDDALQSRQLYTFFNSFIDKRIKFDKLENRGYDETTNDFSIDYNAWIDWTDTG